jgi:hypothetical protein
MHVLDDQHDSSPPAHRTEQVGDRGEQPVTLSAVRPGRFDRSRGEFRQQPLHFDSDIAWRDSQRGLQHVAAFHSAQLTQRVRERQ